MNMCFNKVLHAQNAEHYVTSHFRTGLQNFFSKKDMLNMRQKYECFHSSCM